MGGIAIAGSVIVDRLNEIRAYPHAGELTQIYSVKRAVGGCVPNVAIDLKRICPDMQVLACGKVGDDADATLLRDTLAADGVDATGLRVCNEPTSFTEVMSIPGGQRTFFAFAGACAQFGYDDIDFDALLEKGISMLHLGYFLLLQKVDEGDGLRILREAKRHGIVTSIDLVSENSDRYGCVVECLPYVDNLIINELEAGKLTGLAPTKENLEAMARRLREMGVRERVILHMPSCAICLSDAGATRVPSFALPDGFIGGTTGAGDAFCAGALFGIAQGYDDRALLEFASCAAVGALSAPDAVSGMRSREELLALCQDFPRQTL